MSPLGAADGRFCAVWDNDKQVNVAIIMRNAPSMRTVKPNLIGLKFGNQSCCNGLQ